MTAKPHRVPWILLGLFLLSMVVYLGLCYTHGQWVGADDSVVGEFAKAAGRPPQKSLIDIEHGDLPLFVFLLAGAVGGFILGYYFRSLFGAKDRGPTNAPDA